MSRGFRHCLSNTNMLAVVRSVSRCTVDHHVFPLLPSLKLVAASTTERRDGTATETQGKNDQKNDQDSFKQWNGDPFPIGPSYCSVNR